MTVQPAPAEEDKTWLDEPDEPAPESMFDDRVQALISARSVLGDEASVQEIIVIASWLLGESQPEA